jgi:hypothetical protein
MALAKYFEMGPHVTGHTLPPATMLAPSTSRTVLCSQIHGSYGTTQFGHQDTGQYHSVEHDNSQAHLKI